jgi:hypothetical protein
MIQKAILVTIGQCPVHAVKPTKMNHGNLGEYMHFKGLNALLQ